MHSRILFENHAGYEYPEHAALVLARIKANEQHASEQSQPAAEHVDEDEPASVANEPPPPAKRQKKDVTEAPREEPPGAPDAAAAAQCAACQGKHRPHTCNKA